MSYFGRMAIDTLRTLGFAAISGTYAAVGSAFTHPMRTIRIVNNTNGDLIFSDDAANSTGKLFVPKNTYVLYDISSNRDGGVNETSKLPIGMTIYVKQSTAPSSGDVWIECLYSQGE